MDPTRLALLSVLSVFFCFGQMCGLPEGGNPDLPVWAGQGSTGPGDPSGVGEQGGSTGEGTVGETPSSPPAPTGELPPPDLTCYEGSFDCGEGPESVPCGSWQFRVSPAYGITGAGQVVHDSFGGELAIELYGSLDPEVDALTITLSSAGGGSGAMAPNSGRARSGHFGSVAPRQ